MKLGHIGVDTDYHCKNCQHHHCKICGKCHRCGCTEWLRNTKELHDADKEYLRTHKHQIERKRIKNKAKRIRHKANKRKRMENRNG
jgi:predicted ATP-dependent serine protease